LAFEAATGILLDDAESAAGFDEDDDVGFASSPASVIALSLLLFSPTHNLACIRRQKLQRRS